jgi:hypothetical protein
MKHRINKSKGVVKGAPSGFMISLLIHAVAILLAGMFIVFNVQQKEEKKFVPPKPVERPKMKLKKPKVKVKKTAKPKPTTRIVTKVKRASMPDIQLPEMSGMADGLSGGIGGFELTPDLSEVTLFGGGQTIGNDLVGTFYDFKRDRKGRPIPMDETQFLDELSKFSRSSWRRSKLSRFYRSPKKLYSTCVMMPPVRSSVAPAAFGEGDTVGYAWMVLYEGQLVHPEGLQFRFWGMGDDVMAVRVDNKVVLNASWPGDTETLIAGSWLSDSADTRKYQLGNNMSVVGDWITLEPGIPLDMEVMIGEVPGGTFSSLLVVEVKGEQYERNRQDCPILPMFKTSEPTHELIDAISEHLVAGEAAITNGPIFRDYAASVNNVRQQSSPIPEPVPQEEDRFRMWTGLNGKSFEAEYLSTISGTAVLRNNKGKQLKVPLNKLSPEDCEYIELSQPPALDIDFIKSSDSALSRYKLSPKELEWGTPPPRVNDYTFGARIRQTDSRDYKHELSIEYYAVGQQMLDDRKYILLDRQMDSFVPTKENKRSHRFVGESIELVQYDLSGQARGRKYSEYLVLVTDKRGEIVEYSSSAKWLFENLENLRTVPVGSFMDRTCSRVHPSGPKPNY